MRKIRFAQAALFMTAVLTLTILIWWINSTLSSKNILPNYNQFRLTYSDMIEEIETHWTKLSESDNEVKWEVSLISQLEATHTQLLLYEIESDSILYSNVEDIHYMNTTQLQEYLYQDKSMELLLDKGKYLVSYLIFHEGKARGLGIFIVDDEVLLSDLRQTRTTVKKGLLAGSGLLLLSMLVYFRMLHKRLTRPLAQLEIEAKKIARGQFNTPIIHQLQTGVIGSCFYELDRMRQDLKEMSEQKSVYEQGRKELINYLTHDLRTPLASMRALTEGLLDGIVVTEEAKEQYLKGILKKTEEMERLTSDLFHHANIQLSGFHLEPTELYFDDMINNMISSIEINLKTYKGTYEISSNHPHRLLSADSFRLEQAVMNLIINAIKYSPNGENIRLFTEQIDNYAVIGVEDCGMGIGKEDLPFIFENFYRGEKSRSRQYGGTGLGLSIVKYIAEAHGGFITVKSELGKGSTFKLFLPLV